MGPFIALVDSMHGPFVIYWLTRGTIALVIVCLVFAALYWIENYMNARRSEETRKRDADRFEAERRSRALAKVNAILPLSQRPARRLAMHQERHPK